MKIEVNFQFEIQPIGVSLKSNFYSIIRNKAKEEINYLFQKNGWTIRKSSIKDFELQNSWTELVLESNSEELLLHGHVAYHPDNIKIIRLEMSF